MWNRLSKGQVGFAGCWAQVACGLSLSVDARSQQRPGAGGPPRGWQGCGGCCPRAASWEVPGGALSFEAGVSCKTSEEHMYSNVTLNCSNQLWQPVLQLALAHEASPFLAWLTRQVVNTDGCERGRDKGYGRCWRARAWFPSENYCCHWLHRIIGMNLWILQTYSATDYQIKK